MAFKMKGHTLKGPKQRAFEDDSIINSAPGKYEVQNGVEGFDDTTLKDGRAKSSAFQQNQGSEQKTETKEGHPSGASDEQVAAYKKAGMKWYADRKLWMYPEPIQ